MVHVMVFCPGNCFLNSICCHKVMFVSSNKLWNFPPDSHLPCRFWLILHGTTESMGKSKLRFNDSSSISFNFARAINNNILMSSAESIVWNLKGDLSWEPGNLTLTVEYPWLPLCPKPSVHFFFYAMVPSLIVPLKNNAREYRPAFWHPCVTWKQSLYITCTSERVYTCKFQRKSPKNRCSVLLFVVWLCVEYYRNANIWHMTFGECSFLLTIIFLILIQVVYINSYLFLFYYIDIPSCFITWSLKVNLTCVQRAITRHIAANIVYKFAWDHISFLGNTGPEISLINQRIRTF